MSTSQSAKRYRSPSPQETLLQSSKRKRLPRTGEWIKREQAWKDWVGDKASLPVLWVHGPPGCGKSHLAEYIASELEHRDNSRKVLSFFWEASSTPQSFVDFILDNLNRGIQQETSEGTPHPPPRDLFVGWDRIGETLAHADQAITLVLDGLDEITGDAQDFDLSAKLKDLVVRVPTKVKLLLSSRPEPSIQRRFSDCCNIMITPALVDEDMDRFIASEINGHPNLAPHMADLADPIKSRSEGIFLWAKLYISNLDEKTGAGEVPKVEDSSGLLDDVYARIVDRSTRELKLHDIHVRNTALRWLVAQIRPLNEAELTNVVSIETNMLLGSQLTAKIQEVCASLVKDDLRSGLQPVHHSVRDFLRGSHQVVQQLPDFTMGKAHAALAKTCLSYLSHVAFEKPSEIRRQARGVGYGEDTYRLLEYSSLYWSYHVARAEKDAALGKLIKEFFTTKNAFVWADVFLPAYLDRSIIQPPPRTVRTARFLQLFTMKAQLVNYFENTEKTEFDEQIIEFLRASYERVLEEERSRPEGKDQLFKRVMDLAELYGWLPHKQSDPILLLNEATILASTPEESIEACQALADYHKRDGKYETAESLLKGLIDDLDKQFPAHDKRKIFAHDSLGWTCMRQGKLEEAATHLNQALSLAISNYGSTSPYTIRSRTTLAEVLSKLGRAEEAEVLCRDLKVQIDEHRELGVQLPKDSISQLNTLAAVYMQLGKFDDAIATYSAVVEDRTKVFGDAHRMTLWATTQLGIAKQAGGLLEQAAELFEVLLPKQIQVLSEEHPDVKDGKSRLDALRAGLGTS